MYQVGELILYGNTGVCRVEDVTNRDFNGVQQERQYYLLRPLYQDCQILTPVDNEKVFMRPIVSREEAERLIEQIPSLHPRAYHNRVLKELEAHYKAALANHDCQGLLELTMSIYEKKQEMEQQNRKFGAVDERFLKRGEELLFGELAAALGMEREEVPAYIAHRVEQLQKEVCHEIDS